MKGFSVAEQLQRSSTIPRISCAASTIVHRPKNHVRVVVHGDDFTFTAIELELRKIRSWMCERYDVNVRGILRSGRRDVFESEILDERFR